jgi:uncharacterized protein
MLWQLSSKIQKVCCMVQFSQRFCWQTGLSGKLPFIPINIGNWWNANEEIDVVVSGEKDTILMECKWTSKPVGTDILGELERKSILLKPELENRRIHFAFCSRSGFTPQLIEAAEKRQDILLLDAKKIVG